jgi:hypothetical protein
MTSAVSSYRIIGDMIGDMIGDVIGDMIRNEMNRVHKEICWRIIWKVTWNTPEIENHTHKSISILREIRNPMWISQLQKKNVFVCIMSNDSILFFHNEAVIRVV